MSEPLVSITIDIDLGTERIGIVIALRTLANDRAKHAADRRPIGLRLDEILPQ